MTNEVNAMTNQSAALAAYSNRLLQRQTCYAFVNRMAPSWNRAVLYNDPRWVAQQKQAARDNAHIKWLRMAFSPESLTRHLQTDTKTALRRKYLGVMLDEKAPAMAVTGRPVATLVDELQALDWVESVTVMEYERKRAHFAGLRLHFTPDFYRDLQAAHRRSTGVGAVLHGMTTKIGAVLRAPFGRAANLPAGLPPAPHRNEFLFGMMRDNLSLIEKSVGAMDDAPDVARLCRAVTVAQDLLTAHPDLNRAAYRHMGAALGAMASELGSYGPLIRYGTLGATDRRQIAATMARITHSFEHLNESGFGTLGGRARLGLQVLDMRLDAPPVSRYIAAPERKATP